jgi:hypothetical protein
MNIWQQPETVSTESGPAHFLGALGGLAAKQSTAVPASEPHDSAGERKHGSAGKLHGGEAATLAAPRGLGG